MSDDQSSSGSESAVEWEEVKGREQSPPKENIHIILKDSKKKTNFYEQSLRLHQRQVQQNIHKVHLLCLLCHGQRLIDQCDQQLSQCLLLSLVPKGFSLLNPTDLSHEKTLCQLLRWFVAGVSELRESASLLLSDVQLLVTLCKSLGLRARLVLVLQPSPLKFSNSLTAKSCDDESESVSDIKMSEKKFSDIVKKYQHEQSSMSRKKLPLKRNQKQKESTASPYFDVESSSNSDSEIKSKRRKTSKSQKITKNEIPVHVKSLISSDSNPLYNSYNSWVEVLLPGGKWSALHIPSVSVCQPVLCEMHSPTKIQYVLAFEHASVFRDVTPRYTSQWCTGLSRTRVDSGWWEESLLCYAPPHDELCLEDKDIKDQLLSAPLPTVLSHYKHHPLYVLRSQLLKYEAIYPDDSPVLGHFKGEPVYSRDCVHTLHTRETWLKQGLVVKLGEEPMKSVKPRKRKTGDSQGNTTQLFGCWQTEQFIPAPVVDGKVPRNEYGNVELFTSSMLPKGAVHLTVSGIGRIARKLNIDYAPAMMGWEFNKGTCYPVIDGIVVASEYEDILLEAWQQEQQILIEKDIKKRQKIVLERWVKLTNGLLIQERVRRRFNQTIG